MPDSESVRFGLLARLVRRHGRDYLVVGGGEELPLLAGEAMLAGVFGAADWAS